MTEALVRLNPTRLRRSGDCGYKGYAYSVLGLQRKRPPPTPHRDRGKVAHTLLEYAFKYYAKFGKPFAFEGDDGKDIARAVLFQLYEAEGTSLGELESLEVLYAIRWHLKRFDLSQWEVVTLADGTPVIELDLRMPLMQDVELQAKVDLVLRHRKTGEVWFIDFKTTVDGIDLLALKPFIENDDQLAMGRAVLRANGIAVDYSALYHMRTRPPTPPPLVYKGQSRERTSVNAKAIACGWDMYRATLLERGEDASSPEALKVRDDLRKQAFSLWQVDITGERAEEELRRNWLRVGRRLVAHARGDEKPVRNLKRFKRGGCGKCEYDAWCRAAMRKGGEPDLTLLGTDYSVHEGSPLAGREVYDKKPFEPSDAYVAWAAERGRQIDPLEEFTP